MKSVSDIRKSFLDFFASHEHEVLPSGSLVPTNDPTLMFANAGMNQFKNIFTGNEKPKTLRAATSQKCVRAGGKHNDLENVGYTARHATFFEMLGNFSFGDYFKEHAIDLAWEFVTDILGLPEEKLLATVYHTDDEAFKFWQKHLPDDKIIRIETNDNFWSMGATGPCGPCSEIFYDHGPQVEGGPPGSPEEDGDRFVEIWNLVFMQYEKLENGTQIDLPKPCIDTGMGLERISTIIQGKHSIYEIDLFASLIDKISKESGIEYTQENQASFKVIADHLRSMSFLIADGVMPSNEGRGYVLRRIMRRAMRHVYHLGVKDLIIHKLVAKLVALMGEAYPELVRAQKVIEENVRLEEERFKKTLDTGMKLLNDELENLSGKLSGEVAFKLYDTYGFPLDLTQDILRTKNFEVDVEGFEAEMRKQKERARAAWSGSGDAGTLKIWFDLYEKYGASEFLGYSQMQAYGKVLEVVEEKGDNACIIFNQTPFYAESGGQIGDCGELFLKNEKVAQVLDCTKPHPGLHVHKVRILKPVKAHDELKLVVNETRRKAVMRAHSATHLLHHALREVLGEHITQKGSWCGADRLRFDISHNRQIIPEELKEIEQKTNTMILANSKKETKVMPPEDAIEAGAIALFGEKYGDEVRVVSMNNSIELCGGTHVNRTGDIGLLKIVSESSVASGVRRIEAYTGEEAMKYLSYIDSVVKNLSLDLKVKQEELQEAVEKIVVDKRELEKQLAQEKKKNAASLFSNSDVEEISGLKVIAKKTDGLPAKDLREIAMNTLKKLSSDLIFIANQDSGKVSLIIFISDAVEKFDASVLIRKASEIVGSGGGGGKKNFAQAGGDKPEKIDEAIKIIKKEIAK